MRCLQRISDERAKLSNSFSTTDVEKNDDQGITTRDYSAVILVPSNGYTFERTPTQVSARRLWLTAGVGTDSGPKGDPAHDTGHQGCPAPQILGSRTGVHDACRDRSRCGLTLSCITSLRLAAAALK